jgi:hypothetical protein
VAARELDDDWEPVALRRVAGRVEPLADATGQVSPRPSLVEGVVEADDGFGWEESVLRRLRARLFSGDLAD